MALENKSPCFHFLHGLILFSLLSRFLEVETKEKLEKSREGYQVFWQIFH